MDANGIKVGFLAYNEWNSNYNNEFLESIKNDIKEIKKEASLVVMGAHPHVLPGFESYPNLDGEEKIITYSEPFKRYIF
ncbi:hypothetical protein CHL78_007605 [Romboutsia weinsteinii]|uniref:Uncharacterized protein n=1 Tax=Romboutsia weinsteinii TaxID=2020949 RepID=A0A371J4Z3_9FIRM|nr:hypothetical protein CHL78_007605 [Romboutsia weinsteinii]